MLHRLHLPRWWRSISLSVQPDLAFWLSFLILNALLFLPLYLLNRDATSFWPLASLAGESTSAWSALFLQRANLDPFRLNVEIPVLLLLGVGLGWMRRRAFGVAFAVLYLLTLYYALYEGVTLSIYGEEPAFYNQYRFFVDGTGFLLHHLQISPGMYIAAVAGLIGAHCLILVLVRAVSGGIPVERLSRGTTVGLVVLVLPALFATAHFQSQLADPEMATSSLIYKLQRNIDDSRQSYRKARSFDDTAIRQTYDYADYRLQKKPNIYLIFIESYGSVLYKRPDFRQAYVALADELYATLQDEGWHAASALSEAPTWGGGSWMSYTSALFGLRIDTHPYYLTLFNKYQHETYPDLAHYLQSQGYRHIRLSSISDELNELEWQRYQNFHSVDEWVRYRDLGYSGTRYGWGPAPPDQYALHFTQAAITQPAQCTEDPFLLFFITQNSHYPWDHLPPLVDDWRTLNETPAEDLLESEQEIAHETKRQNYFNSIEYELRYLVDFIQKEGDENSLFILIGDHQPPQVSRRDDGWDTPLHIISRDPALVDSLAEYGFVDGLRVRTLTPALKHEGVYSLLVRVLLAQYGEDPDVLPAYLPDGFVVGDNSE